MGKRKTIHEQLDLPASYRVRGSVSGYIDKTWWEIRALHSGVPGHTTVYVAATSWGDWKEITLSAYQAYGHQLVDLV